MESDLKPLTLQKSAKPASSFFSKHKFITIFIVLIVLGLLKVFGGASSFNFVFGKTNLPVEEGRVNVLLLGIGGGNHDGATLTDTIMLASYDLKTHHVDLISVPRDLWIDQYKAKANTLYQTGLLQGKGLEYVQGKLSEVLGVNIGYTIRVDFSGFVRGVDLVNGVDVEVAKNFDDYEYPLEGKEEDLCGFKEAQIDINKEKSDKLGIPEGKQKVYLGPDDRIATQTASLDLSCRFEHISFKKGQTHMDGATALKFVRSRHGNNNEGSDFARSKRQQLVLEAFRDQVLSLDTLTDPQKLIALGKTFGDSISTNIPQNSYLELMALVKRQSGVSSYVLDTEGKSPLLIHPDPLDYGGGWVLIPPKNDFTNIKTFIDSIVSGQIEATSSAK